MTPPPCSSRSSRSTRPVISTWPIRTRRACSTATSWRGLPRCQARNRATMRRASSRCLSLYQALPKSRWCQMSSMRSSIPASAVPSAASTAAAWMTVPRCRSTSEVPAPAAASSSQRSPHLVNDSTWDGDSWMVPAGERAGVGQRGQRVPLPRVRAADPGRGEPGQLGRGGGPDRPGPARVGGRVAQLGGQRGQRQPVPSRPMRPARSPRRRRPVRPGTGTAGPRCPPRRPR